MDNEYIKELIKADVWNTEFDEDMLKDFEGKVKKKCFNY